ncbi:probable cytidylate kinase, putative [Candidatus Moduliflexus flocculans]|uniref:Probable cytidylate kinase, putative n=1 Tax=Candidatus Moduliflexus flocculans TaxID=1499966 RepID=A0A0S6W732_9BACT|nr:probable cytidylate kinase, putative [Candidatus Moduliflexus flocculans]
MAVITISRQYGSAGDDIARQVCEALGYRYFDKRALERIASSMGMAEGEYVDFMEDALQPQPAWKEFLSRIRYFPTVNVVPTVVRIPEEKFAKTVSWGENTTGATVKQVRWLSEEEESQFIRDVVLNAYQEGNFVIVGRGGQVILKDKPGVLHVRIVAPEDARTESVAAQQHLNNEAARTLIHQHDRAAADYIKRLHHADWDDPLLYHLIINTRTNTPDLAVQMILTAARHILAATTAEPGMMGFQYKTRKETQSARVEA